MSRVLRMRQLNVYLGPTQSIARFSSDRPASDNSRVSVFYDGKCGLCHKEISHYKKIAPRDTFQWQDITECDKQLAERGVSLADGLRLLHTVDQQGKMHVGVDSFILIWKHLHFFPWGLLANVVSVYPVKKVAEILYKFFAQKRFDKLDHCQMAARKDTSKNTKT